MALGWAIYGTWNWWTWWLHEILEHEMSLYIFLNTNNSNNTNVFLHTWTRDFFEHEIRRRPTDRREVITRITRMFFGTRISQISRILSSWCLNTNFTLTDFEPSARCEWQLVVVVDSLWLLTRCGYWLVVVIDLLCFKWQIKKDIREPCEALADPWDPLSMLKSKYFDHYF